MSSINEVPEEILEYILCLISPYNDLRSCRQVCQRWYNCCQSVVEKRRSRFTSSLKLGQIEWHSPTHPATSILISRRYSHSASIFDSSMYIFGGCTSTNTTFNDLWRFNLGTNDWTRLLTTGTYPSPKAYASMVTYKSNLVLFGGWTHPSLYPLHQQWVLFSELHIYDVFGNRWTQLYYPGSPPPTAGHSATIHGNTMVVFGGLQKQEGTSQSTNDIFCLDFERQTWFKPQFSDPAPNPRYGHSQIKVNASQILVLAGCGGSNKLYNDLWLLTIPKDPFDRTLIWEWEQIQILNTDHMPSQLWYNPACRVGNNIIVLSSPNAQGKPSQGAQGSMSQILVPGQVRRQPANIWIPPVQAPENRGGPENRGPPENIPEYNVNGQRGVFRGQGPQGSQEYGPENRGVFRGYQGPSNHSQGPHGSPGNSQGSGHHSQGPHGSPGTSQGPSTHSHGPHGSPGTSQGPSNHSQGPHVSPGTSQGPSTHSQGPHSSQEQESSSDEGDDNTRPGRPRPRPSIRPNASCDRERRLQVLSRMTERLRELSRQQELQQGGLQGAPGNSSLPVVKRSSVTPHLLDISRVLSDRQARWLPANTPNSFTIGSAPQPSLLYSLVLGRGHLVMFGGIPHDPMAGHNQDHVSNTVTFISAPTSSYFAS